MRPPRFRGIQAFRPRSSKLGRLRLAPKTGLSAELRSTDWPRGAVNARRPFWLPPLGRPHASSDARTASPALFDLGQLRNAGHAAFFDDERADAVGPVGGGLPVAAALVEVPQEGRGEHVTRTGRVCFDRRLDGGRV